MSDQDRIRLTFEDFNADQAVSLIYTPHDSEGDAILDYALAIVGVTAAEVILVRQDSSLAGPTPALGGVGAYATVNDMVTAQFEVEDGSTWPVTWPSPLEEIFLPDGQTLDAANAAVATLIVWLLVNATTKDGMALVDYQRGWRWFLDNG